MRVTLSARLEVAFKIPAPAFYAFLRQQVPSALPKPLLDASQNFTLIDPLVQSIASMIFGLSSQIQTQTLTTAIALDYIGAQYTDQISRIVNELQAHHTTDLLNQPYLVGNTTLAKLLDVAALPQAKQQAFAQALATNSQSMRDFWRTLGDGQHGLTTAEASSVERTLSIGTFVKNFTPLMQNLLQGFSSGTYQALPDLARLSKQDWVRLVNQTGAPPSIDAAGNMTPAEVFASVIYTRVTRAYPTAALSSRITTSTLVPQVEQPPLVQFFKNNPSMELLKDNIPAYLASQGDKAFTGIGKDQQAAVVSNARKFQRVLRVTPDADAAQTLLGLGISSATQIATMGSQQFFIKATAAGLTKPEATKAYQAASQRYASLVASYIQLNRDALGVWPQAMGNISGLDVPIRRVVQGDPTLTTLFGSQDYCATDDCTSVLSPAAYLCDLLLWLRNHPQGAKTALDVLDNRRPDIRHLLLNCPNTDIELPYIDLVNELLADKISPPTDPNSTTNPIWKQTSADITIDQLKAAPEFFSQAAFVSLSTASYPQSLPYSTGLDALRTYLQQWNLPLWQLRQALLPLSGATTDQQLAVAAERFKMSSHATDLVVNANFVTAAVAWNIANPATAVAPIPAFLQAAGLTYEQLLELLDVAWVQGGLNIKVQGIDDTCMTSTQSLTPSPLDAGFLDRAHRFIRLRLAAGYKMWELDLLLNAPKVGNGALSQATLIAMLSFRKLQDTTKLPVDQLLAFYQDIDTSTHRDPDGSTTTSLYAQIFLNPTVAWLAPDPDMAAIPTGGTLGDPILSDHLKAIQPALGVSGADAAALFALTDNTLTLSNLSLIYRVNELAIASKFSIANLISVAGLLNPTAANAAAALASLLNSPADTLAFLGQAATIQKAGLSLDALTYLLTPPSSTTTGGWATTTQMTQANIASTLSAVQSAVITLLSASTTLSARIDAVQTSITVANGAGFPQPNFSVVIGSEILLVTGVSGVGNTTWAVTRGQHGTTAAAAASGASVTPTGADVAGVVISAVAANAHSATSPGLANDVSAFILNTFNVPGTTKTLLSVLTDPEFTGSSSTVTSTNFPSQFVSIQLFDKIAVLVRSLRFVATDLTWLVANAAVYGGLDFTQLPVTTAQTALNLQPLLTTLLTIKLARLWAAAAPASTFQSLYDIIAAVGTASLPDAASTQSALATITGWPLTDIEAFAAALGLAFPANYKSPATYDALRTLEAMSSKVNASGAGLATPSTKLVSPIGTGDLTITVTSDIGFPAPGFYVYIGAEILLVTAVGGTDNTVWTVVRGQEGTVASGALAGASVTQTLAAQIVGWGTVPQDEISAESLAASALGTLKAQQSSNATWLSLAPTLMNPIRENRSAALQAFLTAQRDGSGNLIYPDTDSLFNYFLIDVQMSSCQVTSRVVQAYIAVQIFVERCLMNLEAPAVVVDLTKDDTWNQWEWMSRYRVWEANREVFLYPENWLIESQRPNRTEIYQTLEQEIHQGQSTTDYLETVVLNYIDRLDGLAHLLVTGTCEDSSGNIYVVARTHADPPVFYIRSYINGAWTGWTKIPLDIKAHQAIPAVYRGRVCLFWMDAKISTEPHQNLPSVQPSSNPPSQEVERYVTLSLYFSVYRNGSWSPAQTSKGKLFDKPLLTSQTVSNNVAVEALYTLKVQPAPVTPGYGSGLWLDVFRFGIYDAGILAMAERFEIQAGTLLSDASKAGTDQATADVETATAAAFEQVATSLETNEISPRAVHVGRAVFDGRFSDLELNNLGIAIYGVQEQLLTWAQSTYGPDAQSLLPLSAPDPDLTGEPFLNPQAGALITGPANVPAGYYQIAPLTFTSIGALEQNVGPLLNAAMYPFRVVGPDSDLNFDPASYFFFQDTRRSYWVESQKYYWTGSMWSPATPSDPGTVAYQVRYVFHPFYHPFTRLIWNQLGAGGFKLLYDPNLQQNPDQIDPSGADFFSFKNWYQPVTSRVWWDHDDVTGQDRQYLDFNYNSPFSVYNWELFYHIPLYIAQLLSQNQQFEDAQTWFHYIFNPTRQGSDPVPQRFWIPKPLHNLTGAGILAQQINKLLLAVNQGDPTAVAEVENWRQNSFNPFLLADLRKGVPYMKSTVMSYLDNLIAWGDNLFSTESREALSEATLLYVVANEILGPTPVAVTPPPTADESYDQLEPSLDAFANAMVEIENAIGGSGGSGTTGNGQGIPGPQTFYFKIPSNPKLLGYWDTVADRLFKLRHCQNISGAPLQLALFDAPIDPGLLIAAQAAGVDLSSVLTDLGASLPNYRFTALYTQALDFVNAVRAYGASLQAALEKTDAGALALLQQTTQQQLLIDGDQVLDWQVQQAQSNIDAVTQSINLAQQKYNFNHSQDFANAAEYTGTTLVTTASVIKAVAGALQMTAAVAAVLPNFTVGAAGFGGSPVATVNDGGVHAASAAHYTAHSIITGIADLLAAGGALSNTIGNWEHRKDNWNEAATEAQIQIAQAQDQLNSANLGLQIAQQNQITHQEQIDNIQKQIDFLTDKFTSDSLYDWMVSSLSATYFQSYQLAYQMCKQVERCYRYELGILDSSFIKFGYWDSLHKGLLAGETLNHDLRRMQSSYLQQNARRYELSRFVSLSTLDPGSSTTPSLLQRLLVNGWCDFNLPESLFDADYPGHYNRRLTRVSMTVVYPSPGKFDNVKATLTLISNQVRVSTQAQPDGSDYAESPVGADARFVYNYGAVPQKIATGNAQDDPGLFITAIASNIADQRYLPFENAGAVSSWHLEMPQLNNEIDLSTVGDVVLHLYYTALDGGATFQTAVEASNASNLPTSGIKAFSAQNDFAASTPTVDNPYPLTPWQALVATQKALFNGTVMQTDGTQRWEVFNSTALVNNDQVLTLAISPSKFPAWTRGKTISVTSITLLAVAWESGNFVLAPQAPLPTASVNMTPVTGVTEPNVCAATITMPPNTPLGAWSFKIKQASAADFRSLTKNLIGDVVLLVNYDAS